MVLKSVSVVSDSSPRHVSMAWRSWLPDDVANCSGVAPPPSTELPSTIRAQRLVGRPLFVEGLLQDVGTPRESLLTRRP